MATAAFDPTAGGDSTGPLPPPSAGADDVLLAGCAAPSDQAEAVTADPSAGQGTGGRRVGAGWDVVAALVRAVAIVLGVTAMAWALARRWPTRSGDPVDEAYGLWLVRWLPVSRDLADAAAVTAQLALVALAVAVVGGLVLAVAARWRRLTRPAAGAALVLAALAGPALAVTARYWLIERRGLTVRPGARAVGPASSWRRAVDDLLLPAAAAGLPAAPALAALFTPPRPGESRWWTGLASPLADRAPLGPAPGPGPARPVGLPVAVLLAGVAGAEIVFGRPGLLARLHERSALTVDPRAALEVVTALAVGLAAAALVVDLAALALAPLTARRRARRPEPRAGTETLFAATSGPAAPPARAVRTAVVLVAGLVVGGLIGAVAAPRPVPAGSRRFGPPLLDGVLGSDGAGRDLLALTATGLGEAVLAAFGPALLAAVVALALAPAVRRLPRTGRLVPGALVDGLWMPAGVLAVMTLPAVGFTASLLDPRVLAATGAALVPLALRSTVRTARPARAGRLLHALALWLLLVPAALTAHVMAGFLGPDADQRSLGRLLANSIDDLARSPWPAVWPAAAAGLLMIGCTDLGSSLAALARQRADRRPDSDDEPWALSMRAVHDERPWYDGTDQPDEPPADAPSDPTAAAPDPSADVGQPADAGQPTERVGLAPNFDLQPGLPPPALGDTMRLPVVRVRLADPVGAEPDGRAADDLPPPEGAEEPG